MLVSSWSVCVALFLHIDVSVVTSFVVPRCLFCVEAIDLFLRLFARFVFVLKSVARDCLSRRRTAILRGHRQPIVQACGWLGPAWPDARLGPTPERSHVAQAQCVHVQQVFDEVTLTIADGAKVSADAGRMLTQRWRTPCSSLSAEAHGASAAHGVAATQRMGPQCMSPQLMVSPQHMGPPKHMGPPQRMGSPPAMPFPPLQKQHGLDKTTARVCIAIGSCVSQGCGYDPRRPLGRRHRAELGGSSLRRRRRASAAGRADDRCSRTTRRSWRSSKHLNGESCSTIGFRTR